MPASLRWRRMSLVAHPAPADGAMHFALATAALAGLAFVPLSMLDLEIDPPWWQGPGLEAAALAAGFLSARTVWRRARQWGYRSPQAGIVVGLITALAIHLLMSIVVVTITWTNPLGVLVLFPGSVMVFGWVSMPLAGAVGWWMFRRLR